MSAESVIPVVSFDRNVAFSVGNRNRVSAGEVSAFGNAEVNSFFRGVCDYIFVGAGSQLVRESNEISVGGVVFQDYGTFGRTGRYGQMQLAATSPVR